MPLGSGPYGTGTGAGFALVSVEPITPNQLRVSLSGVGSVGSRFEPGSILDPESWEVEALDPDAVGRLVQTVELVSDSPNPVVDVFLDGVLGRVDRGVTVVDVRGYRLTLASGAFLLPGCDEVDFESILPQFSETTRGVLDARDALIDIANPQVDSSLRQLGGLALGTFIIGSDGDLANDRGILGLKKRIIRRLTTMPGGFFHLPGYGLQPDIKRNITPDLAARLASRARAQILQEPDVASATVTVTRLPAAPNVIGVIVRVRSTLGEEVGISVRLDPDRNG